MKVLWAPWRMAFIAGKKAPGCIFCNNPSDPDSRNSLVLAVTPRAVVMLNRYPYSNGHLLIAPRRHTADFGGMRAAERNEVADVLQRSAAILQKTLAPDGLNIGMNLGEAAGAGVIDHFHWHIVPRWSGDTNFMPILGDVRVIPEHLTASWELLRPKFASLRRRK